MGTAVDYYVLVSSSLHVFAVGSGRSEVAVAVVSGLVVAVSVVAIVAVVVATIGER